MRHEQVAECDGDDMLAADNNIIVTWCKKATDITVQ